MALGVEDIADEDLMVCVLNGDHEAFSTLVHRHTKMFYAAAYRMCSDQDEAEDIVQEAFLKLWNRPEIWDASRGAKFTTWFYRVVTNQAIDHIRKKKVSNGGEYIECIKDESISQQVDLEQMEQQKMLERAIQTLPHRQRAALNLCFYEGISNKDAADILGVGVKALESLLMRAKSGLKDELLRCGLLERDKSKGEHYGS